MILLVILVKTILVAFGGVRSLLHSVVARLRQRDESGVPDQHHGSLIGTTQSLNHGCQPLVPHQSLVALLVQGFQVPF